MEAAAISASPKAASRALQMHLIIQRWTLLYHRYRNTGARPDRVGRPQGSGRRTGPSGTPHRERTVSPENPELRL